MSTVYAYLDIDNKRLLITTPTEYWFLMSSTGNYQNAYNICKAFCAGYVIGNKSVEVINDVKEFQ